MYCKNCAKIADCEDYTVDTCDICEGDLEEVCEFCLGDGEVSVGFDDGEGHTQHGVILEKCICKII